MTVDKRSVIEDLRVKVKSTMESYISNPVVKSFLAGSLSGTCSTIVFQPLDLVKTRIQTPVSGSAPTGVIAVVHNVVKNETLIGLWRGMAPSLSRTVPGIGVYFCSLHWLRNKIGNNDPSPLESMLVGASARTVSGISMLPFTVIKTRFESGLFKYNGVVSALVTIYRLEGAKGLYSGLTATLMRDVPFSALYLMFYTEIKKKLRDTGNVNMTMPLTHFSCGIVAGCFASIVTQPADVIKTKMQLFPDRFSRVHQCIFYVYKTYGPAGYFKGLVPRTLRRTLMAALAWTVYEQMMTKVGLK